MKPILALVAALLGGSSLAAGTTVPVPVLSAYLHVDVADTTSAAVAVDLAALGLLPGATVEIRPVGDWDPGPGGDEYVNLLAVFSAGAALLAPSAPHRVPGAVDAGIPAFTGPTWPSGEPTDIPEDFVMLDTAGVTVVIPAGATHLFVTVADIYYRDNSDPDGDFGVSLTAVPTTDVPMVSAAERPFSATPNPFVHGTSLAFDLARDAEVRLAIHDVAGRVVRTLVAAGMSRGAHVATWDGRDDTGRLAAAGVYFVRLEAGDRSETMRLARVR